jgi:hypothetical protein
MTAWLAGLLIGLLFYKAIMDPIVYSSATGAGYGGIIALFALIPIWFVVVPIVGATISTITGWVLMRLTRLTHG